MVLGAFIQGFKSIADDLFRAGAKSADDIARGVSKSADDIGRAIATKADDAVRSAKPQRVRSRAPSAKAKPPKARATAPPKAGAPATRTLAKSTEPGYFGRTARSIANSKVLRTAGKTGAGAVVIGGSVYGLGKLAGAGMEAIGSGYRNLTDARTPEEIRDDQLDNMARESDVVEDKMNDLKKYLDFLAANGLQDSPSNMDIYNRYILGDQKPDLGGPRPDLTNKLSSNPLLLVLGLGAAGAGLYYFTKKKKKTSKKKGKKK